MPMRAIRPGSLRQRVNIEQPPTGRDGYNLPTGDWTNYKENVPASIEAVSGVESWRGLKVDALTTHAVEMRFDAGVTTGMRLDWDGRKLNIVSLLDRDGHRHSLQLMCKEITNG